MYLLSHTNVPCRLYYLIKCVYTVEVYYKIIEHGLWRHQYVIFNVTGRISSKTTRFNSYTISIHRSQMRT